MLTSCIKTDNLTKYYLGKKVVGIRNLTLEVEIGEIFGFIGPNGAGKSTTIRLLLDLIRPTAGRASIFGRDSHKDTVQLKRKIGYLPGEIFLPEYITGKECLDFFAGFHRKIDKIYLKKLLDRFDLNLKTKVGQYSKGNKQKLAIVLALMHKPELLILDEPTSGLDPLNQQEFYSAITETKKWGATTFFSTHILSEAEKLCDRVGIIKSGKLIAVENIDDFRHKNVRVIHIDTDSNIPLDDLKAAGIRKIERTTTGYDLTISGKNSDIIRHLAKLSFTDLSVAEPSLEEIFMHFYKS